jgi:hypothetical protein
MLAGNYPALTSVARLRFEDPLVCDTFDVDMDLGATRSIDSSRFDTGDLVRDR